MTSNRNKFHVSHLVLAFQLFILSQTLLLPLSARNIKSSVVNKSNQSEILVIMASGVNVTSIYNSFNEFKKMFGVEFPDDRRIAFKNGEGEFIVFKSIKIFFPFRLIELLEKVTWSENSCIVVVNSVGLTETELHKHFSSTFCTT